LSSKVVPVIPLIIEDHPDTEAPNLGIVRIDGYTVVTKKDEWQGYDRAIYIRPDLVYQGERVRVRKFRGVVSHGFLEPAPEGAQIGDDVAEQLGIYPWEPKTVEKLQRTENNQRAAADDVAPPPLYVPNYDVERLQVRGTLSPHKELATFLDGEEVYATEKIDGTNVRVMVVGGTLYIGSHKTWKKVGNNTPFERAAKSDPHIIAFARSHPGLCIYGEGYGWVSKMRYGLGQNEIRFAAFDLYDTSTAQFVDYGIAREMFQNALVPQVPIITAFTYREDQATALASGESLIDNAHHFREGVVLRTPKERTSPDGERAVRKVINPEYLANKGKPLAGRYTGKQPPEPPTE
jgi:RNA ligase (TIGR02306 family)